MVIFFQQLKATVYCYYLNSCGDIVRLVRSKDVRNIDLGILSDFQKSWQSTSAYTGIRNCKLFLPTSQCVFFSVSIWSSIVFNWKVGKHSKGKTQMSGEVYPLKSVSITLIHPIPLQHSAPPPPTPPPPPPPHRPRPPVRPPNRRATCPRRRPRRSPARERAWAPHRPGWEERRRGTVGLSQFGSGKIR